MSEHLRRFWILSSLLSMLLGAGLSAAEPSISSTTYDAKGKRDPFVALVRNGRLVGIQKPGVQLGAVPALFGILWDPKGQSIAMLNDGEAKVGDVVDGYKVLEINRDTVVLGNGAEPIVLQISFEEEPAPKSKAAKGR